MTNLPTDCIQVVSDFLSHKEANSYLQTSKNGYDDIRNSMPRRKKNYFEKK